LIIVLKKLRSKKKETEAKEIENRDKTREERKR